MQIYLKLRYSVVHVHHDGLLHDHVKLRPHIADFTSRTLSANSTHREP